MLPQGSVNTQFSEMLRKRRIALVHDWLTGMRGGEKCLEVFCELFPGADLYTLFYLPDRVSPAIGAMSVQASWLNRLPGAGRYYRYGLPLFPKTVERFDLRDYDLILSSSHCVAKGIIPKGALHIAYIHSPMRYVWDMHEAYFGAGSPWVQRIGMGLFRGYLQRWDARSASRVHHFVANSKNVAGKIRRVYGRDAEVVHPPVDVDRFYIAERRKKFYLIVSALVPYKNLSLAIAAFNRLDLPLWIVGEGPMRRSLEKKARGNVEFLGSVDQRRLAELYAECEALVFPGEEDFGIASLEAQASGRPVIAYAKGGLTESVIGVGQAEDATGIFFSEATSDSLIDAIERYQALRHAFDPAVLRRHATKFSRDGFRMRMRQLIEEKWLQREARNRPHAQTL